MSAHLLLYNASAGSGKTFQLARRFLLLAFKTPNAWKRILAVTFTNKATIEMKVRILGELELLATNPQTSDHLEAICNSLNYTTNPCEEVQQQAQRLRKDILLNYHQLQVMTLDSFLQKMLRSMAREINLSAGYRVELDLDEIKSRMLEHLIASLKPKSIETLWVLEFLWQQIKDEKSWNLRQALWPMAGQWFDESFLEHQKGWMTFQKEVGVEFYKSSLEQQWQDISHKINQDREALEQGLKRLGLNEHSFKGASRSGLAGLIKRTKEVKPSIRTSKLEEPSSSSIKFAASWEEWLSKANQDSPLSLSAQELFPFYQKLFQTYTTLLPDLVSIQALTAEVFQLGLLQSLQQALQAWREQEEALPISDAAPLLQAVMANNPLSFVFEKWGTRFDHFLIDEFQDTSRLQWANLKPLVENGLAQGKESMLVGDTKQAIYRFRNGDAELMASKVPQDFAAYLKEVPMRQNFRSLKGIIDFNSAFFQKAPEWIGSAANTLGYRQASIDKVKAFYKETKQSPGKPSQSSRTAHITLSLRTTTSNSFAEQKEISYLECCQRIEKLLQLGMPPEKMVVLTRTNSDIADFSDFFKNFGKEKQKESWPQIASDGAYKLHNHPAVRLLVAVLEATRTQGDSVAFAAAYQDLLLLKHRPNEAPKALNPREWKVDEHWKNLFNKWKFSPADQVLRDAASKLDLYRQQGWAPFVRKFIGLASQRSRMEGNLPVQFLQWWYQRGVDTFLAVEELPGSIRAMTIHKSKGLEFEAVLIPFLKPESKSGPGDLTWLPPDNPKAFLPPKAPLKLSNKLNISWFAFAYEKELVEQQLDLLNHLYVAFTRAKAQLHIWSALSKSQKESVKSLPVSSGALLWHVMQALNHKPSIAEELHEAWEFGAPSLAQNDHKKKALSYAPGLPQAPENRKTPGVSVKGMPQNQNQEHSEALRRGLIFHRLAESLGTAQPEPERIVQQALSEGWLEPEEVDQFLPQLKDLCQLPLLTNTAQAPWEVWNEAAILVPGGEMRRPDRVAIKGNEVAIIDYKTGAFKNRDLEQLSNYRQLLLDMGYAPVQAHLIYLDPITIKTLK